MPIYFKWLEQVDALEIVAHRIVWSVPILLVLLYFRKNLHSIPSAWKNPKTRLAMLASALLIAANWLLYVWAVHEDHILAASLGYFISPLLGVLMGRIFLGEQLSKPQWVAVGIAAIGVSVLAFNAWQTLWISLVLAGSWTAYALVRKVAEIGPVAGLTMETSYLFLPFLLLLVWLSVGTAPAPGQLRLGDDLTIDILLIGGAIMTAIPLVLFATAVKTMTLSAIGILNYLAPTIQFLVGYFIYNEPLTTPHMICFSLIWLSLAIYSGDSIRSERQRRLAPVQPA